MASVSVKYLIVLCLALPQVYAFANWTADSNDHLALANATILIARQHFSTISTTVVIIEKSVHPHMYALNTRLMEHVLLNLKETVAVELYLGQSEHQPWDYHIFVVDSAEAFRQVRMNFPKTRFERKFRFLIVLTYNTRAFFQVLKQIFTFSYELRVLNVNVILDHPLFGVCMYTYKLFTEHACRLVQPVLHFRFKDDIRKLTHVFAPKLLNFHRCPIRVTARQNPPLLVFSGDPKNPKPEGYWKNLNGIDGQLIRIISKELNFTIDLLPFPREWRYFDNNATHGCFTELLNGNADIAIGGFSASDPQRSILSSSVQYHSSPVVFVVRGGRDLRSVSRLGRPFKHKLWCMVAAFLVLVTFLVYALRAVNPAIRLFIVGKRVDTPLMNFFAIFLGYSITQIPRRNFARYALLLWLMVAMILRNAYQGSLYNSIRMDRFARIPSGYEELLKWNYVILVSSEVNDLNVFPKNQTLILGEGYELRFKALELMTERHALVALRDNFLSYIEQHARHGSELKMIKEPLYVQQNAMYFPKHSMYKAAISKKLWEFSYLGITSHIARHKPREDDVLGHPKKGVPPKRVSNDQLIDIYKIYLGMVSLAVLVFVLELLSVYCKKLRCFIEWIN